MIELKKRILHRIRKHASRPRAFAEAWRCRALVKNYDFGAAHYQRIYHYHIRKTGGTSLNQMFLALSGRPGEVLYAQLGDRVYEETLQEQSIGSPERALIVDDKVFVGWNKHLIERGHYFYAFSHLPAHSLKLPERTFTVTCLREPCARLVSLYNMLTYYDHNKFPHPGMVEQSRWLGQSFADFLARVPRRELLGQLYMFSPRLSINEAFDNILKCSHFFFSEDFSTGVNALSEKLGLSLQSIHVRKARHQAAITAQDMERLCSLLEPEILLYERLRASAATL